MIHKSHSKKELYDIITVFEIPLSDYHDLTKKQLHSQVIREMGLMKGIKAEYDNYCIETLSELKEYLKSPNQSKMLSIKDKDRIMKLSKYLIHYAKNNYMLAPSHFMCIDEVISAGREVAEFCDIPTARRAITLANQDEKIPDKFIPKISPKVVRKLEEKQDLKRIETPKLVAQRGSFRVTFE
jgi:hypothetical protein